MTEGGNYVWNTMLKKIPSPGMHEHTISSNQFTYLVGEEQAEFATVHITIWPQAFSPELRSITKYLYQFRDKVMTGERAVENIWRDFTAVYKPSQLKIELETDGGRGLKSNVIKETE